MWTDGATGPETTSEAVRRLLGLVADRLEGVTPQESASREVARELAGEVLATVQAERLVGMVRAYLPAVEPGETWKAYAGRVREGGVW